MKTKLIGLSTVILLVAGLAMAQTSEVSSVNVVGYIKVPLVANRWKLVAVTFDSMTTTNPTVGDVFGTNGLPDTTQVLLYRGGRYVGEVYYDGYGWDPGTNILDRGEGCWVKSPQNSTLTMAGEVPAEGTLVATRTGYQILGYPFPVSRSLSEMALSSNVLENTQLLTYNGTNYVGHVYYEGYGWDPDDTLKEGEGWWLKGIVATNFVEPVPYSL